MSLYKNKIAFVISFFIILLAGNINATNKSNDDIFSPSFVKSYLSGDYAIRSNNPEEASRIFLEALKESPDNSIFLKYGYNLMLNTGNIDKSVELAEQYTKIVSTDSNINILRATQAVKNQDYDKADEILNISTKHEAITVSSSINRVILPFLQLWVKIGQGKNDESTKYIDKKIADSSAPSLFAQYQKALINDFIGNTEEAEKSFFQVINKDAILPYHFVKSAGNFYERTNKKDKAIELYKKYQTQFPNSGYFRFNINNLNKNKFETKQNIQSAANGFAEVLEEAARVLFSSGYGDEGISYLRLAMYLEPENDETKMLLSTYYQDNEKYKDAVRVYNQIAEDSDFYLTSQIAIAESLYNDGQKDKAIQRLKSLTKNKNPSMIALLTLADLYRKESKFKYAVHTYTKVISLIEEPSLQNWPIFFARGICYERSNQWDLAQKDLQKALQLKPNQPEVLNYLGYSWIDRNENIEQAKDMISSAVKARPDDPQIIDSMGWALYKINDFDNASLYLERAAELTPYDATINDHLGDSYWRQGRFNEARFQWNRVLKYNNSEDLSEKDIRKKLRYGLPDNNDNS